MEHLRCFMSALLLGCLGPALRPRAALLLGNIALRRQLAVYQRRASPGSALGIGVSGRCSPGGGPAGVRRCCSSKQRRRLGDSRRCLERVGYPRCLKDTARDRDANRCFRSGGKSMRFPKAAASLWRCSAQMPGRWILLLAVFLATSLVFRLACVGPGRKPPSRDGKHGRTE